MRSKSNLHRKRRRNLISIQHAAETQLKGFEGIISIKTYRKSVHVHFEPGADLSRVPRAIENLPLKIFVSDKVVPHSSVQQQEPPQTDNALFGKSQASMCCEEGKSVSSKSVRQRVGLTIGALILAGGIAAGVYYWRVIYDYLSSFIQSLGF